ncbi:MAG: vitamin B12-dependent ribonucleotide reductase, partial [Candidatus Binatia bacterium]
MSTDTHKMKGDAAMTDVARRRKDEGQEAAEVAAAPGNGLAIPRYFTTPGADPFDAVEWELRSAVITGEKGEVVFEQHSVEIPKSWSQLATSVVVSKYFRGPLGSPEREHSVRQLIGRVVRTLRAWGERQGYFATPADAESFGAELTHLLVEQKASVNSPVWFNVGLEPQP